MTKPPLTCLIATLEEIRAKKRVTKIARASGLVDLYLKSVSVGKSFCSLYELAYPRRGSPSRICKVPDVTASEYRK